MMPTNHFLRLGYFMLMAFLQDIAMAANQAPLEASLPDLTELNVEELLNIDLSSVMKTPTALKDVPASIYVLTSNEIRRTGATTIPEALRVVPGLHVARVDGNKWAISARGFNGVFANKLLVLMDGRAVYTPLFSGAWWDQEDVMMDDIERIEVIRGPGASLWGTNAVNGVINIVTKRAKDTQGGLVSAYGGNMRLGGGLRYGTDLGDDAYLKVYARHSNYDEAQLPNSNADAGDNSRLSKIGFRFDKDFDNAEKISVQGDVFSGFSGGAAQPLPNLTPHELPTLSSPYSHLSETDLSFSGHYIMGRWQHAITSNSSSALRFFWSRNERQADLISSGYQIDTLDLDFQHNLQLNEQHYLTWGTGARLNFNNTTNGIYFAWHPDFRLDEIYSLFVQDEITLVPERWKLTLGAKLEHNPVTQFEWQPNARLAWTPSAHQSFWTSVSRAVRTPNWWEQDVHYNAAIQPPKGGGAANPANPATLITIRGGQNLKSEDLLAYELGWRSELTPGLTTDVTLFYYDYHHISTLTPNTLDNANIAAGYQVQSSSFTNYGLTDIYGGEASLDWRITEDWKLRVSYTHTEEKFRLASFAPALTETTTAGSFPTHQAMLWSIYQLTPQLNLDLNWRYVDGLKLSSQPTASYHELDARLAWDVGHNLELSLIGRNLLNKQHVEFGSAFFAQATAIQREIYATVRWEF
ncbi:MAG: TonB-dependent receptor [Methylomicrobium sp.]|nr:TonB-dependent receptor [Methylomicrobium sp.]